MLEFESTQKSFIMIFLCFVMLWNFDDVKLFIVNDFFFSLKGVVGVGLLMGNFF